MQNTFLNENERFRPHFLCCIFAVAQNLQNIIQEQIQTLSTGTSTSNAAASASAAVLTTSASSNSTVTTSNASSSISNRPTAAASSTTNGLLYGVPPPPPPAAPTAVTAPTASSTTPIQSSSSINSNAQAALMILLTAQMQSQSGEPSLLQNPQVVSILQTLVNNAGSPGVASSAPSSVAAAAASSSAPTTTADNKQNDINELLKDPSLASVFNRNEQQHQQSRPALLDTPKTTSRPILLGNAPNTENVLVDNSLLSNTQSLTQLLGVLSSDQQQPQKQPQQQQVQQPPPPPVATQPTAPQPVQQQQALLANPPPTSYSGYYPASAATVAAPHQPQQRPVLLDGSSGSLMGFAPYSTNQFLLQPQQPPQQLYMQPQMLLQGFGPAAAASIQAQQAAYLGTPANMAVPQFMVPTTTSGYIPTPIGYHPSSQQQPPQHTFNNEAATPPQGHQQGLKRRLNIPPSPEQSPEGTYVGQHSQGIGGHYASSYFSKKAKKY